MCFQEVVEEPATDGDSDHTDREGSLNTKNTCELVLFFQCYMQYGNEPGYKANILMYIIIYITMPNDLKHIQASFSQIPTDWIRL